MFDNEQIDGQRDMVNCLVEETVRKCFNTNIIKLSDFHKDICSGSKQTLDCRAEPIKNIKIVEFLKVSEFKDDSTVDIKLVAVIIVSIVVFSVFLIFLMFMHRNYKRQMIGNRCVTNAPCTDAILNANESVSDAADNRTSLIRKSEDNRVIFHQTLNHKKGAYTIEQTCTIRCSKP